MSKNTKPELKIEKIDLGLTIEQEVVQEVVQAPKDHAVQMVPLHQVAEMIDLKVKEALANQPKISAQEAPKEIKVDYSGKNINTDEIPGLENFDYKDRTYVTTDGSKSPTFEIRSRHKKLSPLQFTNPKTRVVHTLRYASNHPSFFVDQQKGSDVLTSHILLKSGVLFVPKENTTLQRFLEIHPDKDKQWKEYDPAFESKKEVDQEEILFKAQFLSREISPIELDSAARIFCSGYSEQWDPYTLKREVFSEIKKRPEVFIKIASDPSLKAKGIIKTALQRGFILYKNYKYYDSDNIEIIQVGRNENELDAMINHIATNEGKVLYDYLENAIN